MKKSLLAVGLMVAAASAQTTIAPGTALSPATSSAPYAGAVFVASTGQGLGVNGGTSTAINTTGANFISVCVTRAASVTTTLSDSPGNTFTLLRSDVASGQSASDLYYVYNPTTSATHTFTTSGTGSKSGVIVQAFGNMASNPLDQQNGANSTGNNTTFGPGAITPTTNDEVITPCIANIIAPTTAVFALPGYLNIVDYGYSGSTRVAGAGAYQLQGGLFSTKPVFTWNGTTSSSQAASVASFISNGSAIADCTNCAFLTQSTNSGGSGVPSDPTSLTGSVPTGTLFIALGWHTNFSGTGTTTVTGTNGAGGTWHSCLDGSTNAFTDLEVTATVGMSCNYVFTTAAGSGGATIAATDCTSNCTNLGGIYLVFSGVFVPRAWDSFASHTLATSGSGANNMTAGTLAPTQANDLVIVYCNNGNGTGMTSAGTSPIAFTLRQNLNGGSESAIYSSSSSVTPTFTGPNTSGYGCMSVAFK